MRKDGRAVALLNLGVRHNDELLKAAKSLANARSHLLFAKVGLAEHREQAIRYINGAVDEIRALDENGPHYLEE